MIGQALVEPRRHFQLLEVRVRLVAREGGRGHVLLAARAERVEPEGGGGARGEDGAVLELAPGVAGQPDDPEVVLGRR